jgi:hypothetical protein
MLDIRIYTLVYFIETETLKKKPLCSVEKGSFV